MSAFIVENETIDNIISFLYWKNKEIYFEHILEKKGIVEEKDFESLAEKLLIMNIKAVDCRYGTESDAGLIADYKWNDSLKNIYQTLKSIHCLLYQCSEGDVPETELFKFLMEIQHAIESKIINELPEYQQAKWE